MPVRPGDAGAKRTLPGLWPSLRLAVSVGLLAALLFVVELEALWRVVLQARGDLLLLMLLAMIGERLFAAWRWLLLLRLVEPGLGYGPVLRITLISNYLGTFLSSVVVERLCGLLALLSMIALGLLLAPIALPYAIDLVIGAGLLGITAAGIGLAHPWPRRLARRILARPRLARLRTALVGLERRIDAYLRRPASLALALVLAFAFQGLRVLTVGLGAAALGIVVDPVLLAVIVPTTILVALAPISLGGLGPREATYVGLLGLAGVAAAPALVLALLREAMNLATALPGAILYARGPLASRA